MEDETRGVSPPEPYWALLLRHLDVPSWREYVREG